MKNIALIVKMIIIHSDCLFVNMNKKIKNFKKEIINPFGIKIWIDKSMLPTYKQGINYYNSKYFIFS